jgi:hypothetical protein
VNGLYTSANAATTDLITISTTGATTTNQNQLIIDNCSVTIGDPSGNANLVSATASGMIFSIIDSDLTNNGSGRCVYVNGGVFGSSFASSYNTAGPSAVSISQVLITTPAASANTGIASFSNCNFSSLATTGTGILNIIGGGTATTTTTLNLSVCTLVSLNPAEVNNTTKYINITGLGGILYIQRTLVSTASATVTSITPFQTAFAAGSALLYFGNSFVGRAGAIAYVPPTAWGLGITMLTTDIPGTSGQFLYLAGSTPTGAPSLTYGGTTLVNVTANLVPTASLTYSLGSTTQRWKDIFVGPASLDVNGAKLGATTIGNTTHFLLSGSLLPNPTLTYSLGSTTQRWVDMFVGPGTINVAGPAGSTAVGTIGTDAQSTIYTETGFATPFVNIGPAISQSGAVGGWNVTSLGTAGTTGYDLVAQQNTLSGLTGPVYSLIQNPGPWGATGSPSYVTSIAGTTGITVSSITGSAGTTATIDLADSGVTVGSYAYPSSVTVDGYGRVTSITAGSVLAGATGPTGPSMSYVAGPQYYVNNGTLVNGSPAGTTIHTDATKIYELAPVSTTVTGKYLIMANMIAYLNSSSNKVISLTVGRSTAAGTSANSINLATGQIIDGTFVTSGSTCSMATHNISQANHNYNFAGMVMDAPGGTGPYYYSIWAVGEVDSTASAATLIVTNISP